MDGATLALLTEMGTNLTTLALKGTVTYVCTKIKSIKVEKDTEVINTSVTSRSSLTAMKITGKRTSTLKNIGQSMTLTCQTG